MRINKKLLVITEATTLGKSFFYMSILFTLVCGVFLGIGIAFSQNIGTIDKANDEQIALPTEILDRNGALITTFFSEQNRSLLDFSDIPRILMMALITREDQSFLEHHGFSALGTTRAVLNILRNKYVSGGSTITQQIAGALYADRRIKSIKRKIIELWWALHLEKSWSKQEIITEYLNKVYLGHGNYGVETASQFFFGHSTKELNAAKSVLLIIPLANPSRYSPINNPENALVVQKAILQQMVDLKIISQKTADTEFADYWNNYDYTRASYSSAFGERYDKAPYFSEYIRGILINDLGFTSTELTQGGYKIYTTLDLDTQKKARKYFDAGLQRANEIYISNSKRLSKRETDIYPVASLLTMFFDDANQQLFKKSALEKKRTEEYFNEKIQPIIALSNLFFESNNNTLMATIAYKAQAQYQIQQQEQTVEGALITLDNTNGYIVSMIGGSKFDATNQFNRATSAFVQPGSSFKPLYYAAAVEDKKITPSTIIRDSPVVFTTEEGEAYVPKNYKGHWKGKVSVRTALANSMNVPALKVLHKVGFDKALEIAGALLDLDKKDWEKAGLVKKYPVGLGIVSVSPLSMAKAYATIANDGKKITPIAIRYIEDRNGIIINQNERDKRLQSDLKRKQIITPQTAYIMQSMLQTTVQRGTLAYARNQTEHGYFTQPTGGKTGTTQNWSDAWTMGFTPYYTTAIWIGFDRGGQSLGTNQTGAVTTGPIWGKYMEAINKDLPLAKFEKPQGISTITINPENNKRAVERSKKKINEIFIAGTEPTEWDNPEELALQNDFFESQIESASWNLNIPFEQKIDEDVFFDYLTTTGAVDESESEESNAPAQNKRIRLQLQVPSNAQLQSDTIITNRSEKSKEETTNPFLE